MLDVAITSFVTLFVVLDPIALAPLFLVLTSGMPAAQRLRIGVRACLIAFGILVIFGLAGETLLNVIGIGMPAFRISGGVLLFLTAVDMLFERRTQRREQQTHETSQDPAVFPLATPLLAGPGAMATMILLVGQQSGEPVHQALIFAIMAVVILLCLVFFLIAGRLEHLLGHSGINVITRLFGMLLAALAVQFVLDGLRDYGLFGL